MHFYLPGGVHDNFNPNEHTQDLKVKLQSYLQKKKKHYVYDGITSTLHIVLWIKIT